MQQYTIGNQISIKLMYVIDRSVYPQLCQIMYCIMTDRQMFPFEYVMTDHSISKLDPFVIYYGYWVESLISIPCYKY